MNATNVEKKSTIKRNDTHNTRTYYHISNLCNFIPEMTLAFKARL